MRLSDIIKNQPGGDEPPKKKPSPPAEKPAENPQEDTFRLSKVANFSDVSAAKPPSARQGAEEEAALEPPPLPDAPQADAAEEEAPAVAPEEETAASLPDLGFEEPTAPSAPEAAEPPPAQEAPPARRRGSVLRGPDTEDEDVGGDEGDNQGLHNPFRELRQRGIDYVISTLQAVGNNTAFGLEDAEDFLFDCIETPDAIEQLYSLAVSSKDDTNSLAVHLVNHTTYALKLGRGLKWSTERLVRLGVASLIHDIGMTRVPQHIRHKDGKLTPEELAEIKKHPEHGMNIVLETFGKPFHWLAEAIAHEHEREDGRGYPQGLLGNEISEYGKVIGLADIYEALTHHRPHRKRLLPHKAVQEIIQTQKSSFHHRLLKIMLEELSVFSLNSLVRLNTNAIGRVAETVPGQPLRPIIQIIFDPDGNEVMDERMISLKEFPLLYIVDSLDESEIPQN